jgi:large subunit ribosomal protein L29
VKAEELQTLDGEELSSRLKGARRELYELRFKLAVGQLDDHRQIRKVRKEIARILTVVHSRRLALISGYQVGGEPSGEARLAPTSESRLAPAAAGEGEAATEAPEPVSLALEDSPGEETPEDVEAAAEPESGPPPRKPRRRAVTEEEGNDD